MFCSRDFGRRSSGYFPPRWRRSGGGGGGGGGNVVGRFAGCKAHIMSCHTQSSNDMRSGFTYSKPSNSDWSIFSMTCLENKVKIIEVRSG